MPDPQLFTDLRGRAWRIDFHTVANRRVRAACPRLDLLDAWNPQTWQALQHPETLVTALAALLEDQLTAQSISPEDFAAALGDGDVLDAAIDALTAAVVAFFPKGQRTALAALREKTLAHYQARGTAAAEWINGPESDRLLNQDLDAIRHPETRSAESSSTTAAGSASTPRPPF